MRAFFNVRVLIAAVCVLGGMSTTANADLVISKNKTSNMNCDAGICNATAADAVLNVKDLTKMLAISDLHVFAEGPATDITVATPFGWASANKLTLGAYGSLNVKAAITVTGTSGLTITTNVAENGGLFRLVGVGKISFWDTSSTLIINNTTYTLISNLPALISAIAANPSGAYAFANDYNAAQDGSYPSSPIPTTFSGILEGLGNAIDNLSIYYSTVNHTQIALFSEVGASGQLSDLNLLNVSMQTSGADLASFAVTNQGTISHSSATGAMSNNSDGGNWSAAGLVYDNEGTVTRSHAVVNISGNVEVAGGLALINGGTISLSDASGSISSRGDSGGLVMSNSGIISDSYAAGDVAISFYSSGTAGGLVASHMGGTILRCFATGAVRGGLADAPGKNLAFQSGRRRKPPGINVGGLAGISEGDIAYSYATGSVTVKGYAQDKHSMVGGLVGWAYGNSLLQSYSLGKLQLNERSYLGGVIGFDRDTRGNDDALWDLDTSGVSNPDNGAGNILGENGLKGYSDKQFQKAAMRNFDPAVWAENPKINNGYPYLLSNPPPQ